VGKIIARSNSLERRIAHCAAAFGAVAIRALAICRLVVGLLLIKKARFSVLKVDELTVRKLRIVEHEHDGQIP
jgi:hypothetical protein